MLIQCPRCSTGWRVPDTSATDNPTFKCGRCHHIFREFPGAPVPGERRAGTPRAAAVTADADNLEFIFPSRERGERAPADGGRSPATNGSAATGARRPAPAARTQDPPPADARTVAGAARGADDILDARDEVRAAADPDHRDDTLGVGDDLDRDGARNDEAEGAVESADDADLDDGFDLSAEESEALAGTADRLLDDADDDQISVDDVDEDTDRDAAIVPHADVGAPPAVARVLHLEDTMRPSHGFGSYARLLIALVALHAGLALGVRLAPDAASAWLARVPLAGQLFSREPALVREVELRNVTGGYQKLRNARRVFVISGEAVNHSTTPVERVEVEAKLYGARGSVDQKIVTTGNRTALTDLTEPEIALLQRLDPRATIQPGQSSGFVVVFLEPPRDLREFSSRVLSVRPTRPALSSNPPRSRPRPASVG
jgi:predicted Zn finger-like uncharacterized protein